MAALRVNLGPVSGDTEPFDEEPSSGDRLRGLEVEPPMAVGQGNLWYRKGERRHRDDAEHRAPGLPALPALGPVPGLLLCCPVAACALGLLGSPGACRTSRGDGRASARCVARCSS